MSEEQRKDISSKGMDKKITPKKWTTRRIAMIAGIVAIVSMFAYAFIFMDTRSTLNVEKERLTISTVIEDSFQESIQVSGTVQPIQTIYLDALEGGMVEEVFLESGTDISEGDTILRMSNSDLQLRVMSQTSSIYDQINQTRNSRLNIEQNTLSLKQRLASAENELNINEANYERMRKMVEKDSGLVAEQDFLEARENFEYARKNYEFLYESFQQDSIKAEQQLAQIDESLQRMEQNLQANQSILDRLVVRAPASGQLSTAELNQGQSISSGERIGQIDVLDDFKIRVPIDELYLPRITVGLHGRYTHRGELQELEVTKVYPVVEEGRFEVDMEFVNEPPEGLTRGQTARIRLELGQSSNALLVPRGGFYGSTGGSWIFKVNEEGNRAERVPISLGQQNPDYYEVLEGLQLGDRVITSSYDTFGDNEVLNLE